MRIMDPNVRKEQILTAAKKLFSQNGYYQTQIADIHREAGVARGTIYQYFKNKDDIFETLLEKLYSDWEKLLLTGDIKSNDYMEVFRFRVKQSFEFFFKDPEYCNLLLRVALGSGQNFDRIVERFNEKLVHLIKSNLREAVNIGRVRKDVNLDLATNLLGGALSRMLYYYTVIQKNAGFEIDLDELVDGYVNIVANGILVKQ